MSTPTSDLPIITLQHVETTPADDGAQQQQITSALPVTLVPQGVSGGFPVTGTQDVIVVADQVTIDGALNLNPGTVTTGDGKGQSAHNLTIVCRELSWTAGSSITATGESGSMFVNAGAAGVDGSPHASDNTLFASADGLHPGSGTTAKAQWSEEREDGGQEAETLDCNIRESVGGNGTNATRGDNGGPAGNGGNVTIYAYTLGTCAGPLTITTTGGNGGTGAPGQPGGNGGAGGDMYLHNADEDRWPDGWGSEDPTQVDPAQIGGPPGVCAGGNGGDAAQGGDSGQTGNGGAVSVYVVDGSAPNLATSTSAGTPQPGAAATTGSKAGSPGNFTYTHNDDGQQPAKQPTQTDGAAPTAGAANPGTDGKVTATTPDTVAHYATAVAAYPEFADMLFQRARGAYALGVINTDPGDPSAQDTVDDARTWFTWLSTLSGAVDPTNPNMGPFIGVGNEAAALLYQCLDPSSTSYVDYYGNPSGYLPKLSAQAYLATFESTLEAFTSLYQAWSTYQHAVDASGAQALNVAMANATSLDSALTADMNTVDAAMASQRTAILTAQQTSRDDQKAIVSSLAGTEATIQSHLGVDCSLGTILSSATQLSQLAMFPEEASGVTMAGFAGWSMALPSLAEAVNKRSDADLAIQKLDSYGTDVTGTTLDVIVSKTTLYGQPGPDGELAFPNAYIVINAAQLLEQKLQAFTAIGADTSDSAPIKAAVTATVDTINTFITSVQHVNNLVVQYNSMIGYRMAMDGRRDRVRAQMVQYGADLATMPDPTQIRYVQYLFSLMEYARDQVLAELYLATCSYNVWALSNETLSSFLPAATIDDVHPEVLRLAKTNILAAIQTTQGALGQADATFPGQNQPLVLVQITDPATLATLTATGTCKFTLAAPARGESTSPFGGGAWANIRMTHIAISLDGLVASTPAIHTIMNAYGPQEFYDEYGNWTSYAPTDLNETVNVDCYTGPDIQTSPSTSLAPADPTYPLPSPFTTWTLTVGKDNGTVDLRKITAITLSVSGTHGHFHSHEPTART